MSNQLKAGDLALIVGYHNFHENIGKSCELVEYFDREREYTGRDGRKTFAPAGSWMVEGEGVLGAYMQRDGIVVRTPGEAFVDKAHLIPLRGDFTPDLQKSREVPA
jgi:hypothetical protein